MTKSESYTKEIKRLKEISRAYDIKLDIKTDNNNEYKDVHEKIIYLRRKIIQREFFSSIDRMKSPEFLEGKDTSVSYFSYERSYTPYTIENLLENTFHTKYTSAFVTRSGLSSINLALGVVFYFLYSKTMNFVSYYNYFETTDLINHFSHLGLIRNYTNTNFKEFLHLIIKYDADIIFIENPLAIPKYDNFNEKMLINTLKRLNKNKFRIVIFDSTLGGPLKSLENILKELPDNFLLINIASGLKFYNLGFELSNLGLTCIWCKNNNIRRHFKDRLKAERVTSGLSIEAVEEAYLYPIFKNLNLVEAHYNAILQNSLMYQRVLFKHNIIKKISLSPVIVINNNWTGQQVVEIVHDIHDKLKKMGLELSTGASLGFHLTRMQDIHSNFILEGEKTEHWIRISPGSFFSEVDKYIINYFVNALDK